MEASITVSILDLIINLDQHIAELIRQFGVGIYIIIFAVIFSETGLVVTPFLPGDSLIFILGAFAASGDIDLVTMGMVLCLAGVLGNLVNYRIGYYIGPKIFQAERMRFIKMEYLIRTQEFYEKHGGKAVVIARFMPIFRTFVPFVAGIAKMNGRRFFIYNLVGSCSWVLVFLLGGYLFGNIPIVEKNFTLVVFGVILVSLLPGLVAGLIEKNKKIDAKSD
ncbi:MAG: hypothetical protein GXY34_04845 [Syntrophomonadaceae bacterium]|nr:hypothetical protein [Syntrophomonadaceae bacterium]